MTHEAGFVWEFDAPIEYHDFGRMGYTVVYLPEKLKEKLPFKQYPRLRINADILGYPIDGAFQPGQGKTYLIVSKAVLKQIGVKLGEVVTVQFTVADQNEVSVPNELQAALQQDKVALKIWKSLTPGKQRAFCHTVNSAKTKPTIEKRVTAVIHGLKRDGCS
jgi:hypothetical protein